MRPDFSTPADVFTWMEGFTNLEKRKFYPSREYRLDRMAVLLELAGNPQKELEIYHIAGSKGKGSTAALLASCLAGAGFRTGVFTSPHLYDYRERISLSGAFFSDETYVRTGREIQNLLKDADLPDGDATTFELLTLMAFMIFRGQNCDRVVLETGLGGRLDATNMVTPRAVLLTSIEKEHTEILGETLRAIACEKAGIMKQDVPAYWLPGTKEATDVFREKCRELPCPGTALTDRAFSLADDLSGFFLDARKWKMKRDQDVQYKNAALAVLALTENEDLSPDIIERGLERAVLRGRFEQVQTTPDIILDGAHTPVSVQNCLKAWQRRYGEGQVLVFGCIDGKDEERLAEILAGHFSHVIITRPGTFKVSHPGHVYRVFKSYDSTAALSLKPEPEEALDAARQAAGSDKNILICGSFYTIAALGALIDKAP